MILRDDGSGFVQTNVTQTDRLFDVWGANANDLWVSGTRGVLLHSDASGWTLADSGNAGWLRALSGRSANRVFGAGLDATGLYGAVARYDGTAWSYTPIDKVRECFDVWAAPSGLAWVAISCWPETAGPCCAGASASDTRTRLALPIRSARAAARIHRSPEEPPGTSLTRVSDCPSGPSRELARILAPQAREPSVAECRVREGSANAPRRRESRA